eukprot:SAG11_NODE_659_length_7895_cov_18.189969_11_plen_66_part_00
MTLGYGQTEYARADCCAPEDGLSSMGKSVRKMETGRFFRNRFARLAPIYYVSPPLCTIGAPAFCE